MNIPHPIVNQTVSSRINCRDSNLELLRIFAMLLIVSHHFAVHSGIFRVATSSSSHFLSILLTQFLAYGGKIGVDIFILISGYFLINSTPKLSALLKLLITTFVYSVGIFLIFYLFGKARGLGLHNISILFPSSYGAYWFISCYLSLYIISPFLNKLVFNLSKWQLVALIVILVTLIAVPKIWPYFKAPLLTFVTLYLVAAFIRLYEETIPKKWVVLTAFGCPLLMLVYVLGIDIASLLLLKTKYFRLYFALGHDYSPLVILFSGSMLILFRELKIGTHLWVNRVSAATLGIYLIHDNRFIRSWLWHDVFGIRRNFEQLPFLQFLFFSVAVILTVYLVCTAVDMLREKMMAPLFCWLTTKTKPIDNSIKAFFT